MELLEVFETIRKYYNRAIKNNIPKPICWALNQTLKDYNKKESSEFEQMRQQIVEQERSKCIEPFE